MGKKRLFLICLLILLALLTGCSQNKNDKGIEKKDEADMAKPGIANFKSEVIVGMSDSCDGMDPQAGGRIANNMIYTMLHNGLLWLNESTNEIAPMLAERWEISDNDTTYTFYLRKDAKFHNGETMTASDVLFTFERGKRSSYTNHVVKQISEISAPDDYTIVMKLFNPDAEWLYKIAHPNFSILSKKALTKDPVNGVAIGAGPYVLDRFELNDYIAMHRFKHYWNAEKIKTEKFEFHYIPDDSARIVALQNGEIDVCLNPANNELSYIANDPNLELHQMNGTNCQFITFNTKKAPFNNKKFRLAIAHAVNREEIIAIAMSGYANPAKTFWGITSFGYYDGFTGYEYNIEQAKKILAEAGYPNGLDVEIACIKIGFPGTKALTAQLKKIGINATIKLFESASINAYMASGDYEMAWYGNSFTVTADSVKKLYFTGTGNNKAFYSNPVVDEKLLQAESILDEEKRLQLYKEVQEIASDELPYIPIYYRMISWGSVKGFDGLIADAGLVHNFAYSYVSK